MSRTVQALGSDCDPLVFHATGTGGQSMEKLVDQGLISGAIDCTTTEICDLLFGRIFPATEDRLGAIARTGVPWAGSVGALDIGNFAELDTVPERYRRRLFHEHNPQVPLMRTTAEENAEMGRWLGDRLNACARPVRLPLPEGRVSALDAPGAPFCNPTSRTVTRLPLDINNPAFANALVAAFREAQTRGQILFPAYPKRTSSPNSAT
ncbi:hypothetical protein ACN2XU_19665 [Primorskyibacter sp. 2E107]